MSSSWQEQRDFWREEFSDTRKSREQLQTFLNIAIIALRNIAGQIQSPGDLNPERFLAREALAKIETLEVLKMGEHI